MKMSGRASHAADMAEENRKNLPVISDALRKNWTMAHIRPESTYKRDLADLICAIIAQGKTVNATARLVGVHPSTIFGWARHDFDGFRERFNAARDDCVEKMVDEIVEIADDSSRDIEINNKTGKEQLNAEVVQRSKLRIEARKWIAAMVKPNRYGERIKVESDTTLRVVSDEPMTIELAKEEWLDQHSNVKD